MTLDEAIAHAREVAKEHKEKAEYQRNRGIKSSQIDLHIQTETEQAKEHEQLAEWLEDYKRLKAERSASANRIRRIWCNGYDKGVTDVMSKVKELQEKNLKEREKFETNKDLVR